MCHQVDQKDFTLSQQVSESLSLLSEQSMSGSQPGLILLSQVFIGEEGVVLQGG